MKTIQRFDAMLLSILLLFTTTTFVGALGHCDCQKSFDTLYFIAGGPFISNDVFGWHNDGSAAFRSNRLYTVPEGCGECLQILAGMVGGLLFSGTATSPLGFDQDPFYGYQTVGWGDVTGWCFEIWVTNSKIYAYYARLPLYQTPSNFYASFRYLVPIADRKVDEISYCEVALYKHSRTVSYRVNGAELLRLDKVGTRIDDKFMISDYGGYFEEEGFPDEVFAIFGGTYDKTIGPVPHGACQRALFNQCFENIRDAKRTDCQYNLLPGQDSGYSVLSSVGVKEIAINNILNVETCPQWTCDKRRPADQLFKRLAKI